MDTETLPELLTLRKELVSRIADLRLSIAFLGENANYRIKLLLLHRLARALLYLDLLDCKITLLRGEKITVYWTPTL